MEKIKCLITGCEIFGEKINLGYKVNGKNYDRKKYEIILESKKYTIYTSGLEESFFSNELCKFTIESNRQILINLIKNKDVRIQGILHWNCPSVPNDFISIKKLLEKIKSSPTHLR